MEFHLMRKFTFFTLIICVVILFNVPIRISAQTWQSSRVYYGTNNKLVYVADTGKNVIPDFSYAGYKKGEYAIPVIPVVKTISPVSGDNTLHIQNAIDSVGALPLNANGFRGTLFLTPGIYNVYGVLSVNYSGVVIRGAGNGSDSLKNTIIYGRGDTPTQRDLITIGGGTSTLWADSVKGTTTNIVDVFVPVGSRTFTVASTTKYAVGDNIVIYHPCTDAWLKAVNYGSTHDTSMNWKVGKVPIFYNRMITAINGNVITIDAPIFNHLNKSLSQSFIYKYSRSKLKTNIGIENLRIDIETLGGTDENHIWNSIVLTLLEDGWVKNCTMLHFGYSGVVTLTTTRVTVDSCQALDPVSVLDGERRDNFNVNDASQLILFQNCIASNGRHHYISTGTSHASGNVFYNCKSIAINNGSEGHRLWSQGILFDNIHDSIPNNEFVMGLHCRGSMGSGHGWGAVHSVAWNCNAGGKDVYIQQPPTGQNYAIGCFGNSITGTTPPAPFSENTGFIEGSNKSGLYPASLYLAQLKERLQTIDVHGETVSKVVPDDIALISSYPNPFNPAVTIEYTLGRKEKVEITIFNSLGSEILTLKQGYEDAGKRQVLWNPSALHISSGTYICRIRTEHSTKTIKLMYLK